MASAGDHKKEGKHDISAKAGFGTKAIHAGQPPDVQTGAVCVPISLATTFVQTSPGQHLGYDYSRSGNPTRAAFEACVAALENGTYGLAFSSGLGATTTITNMLKSGDHIISSDDVYGGTNRYFSRVALPSNGITTSLIDINKEGEIEKHITPKTRMIWMETPTNPTLKISDIKATSVIAKKHGLLLVVDNTFMSPYFQKPLELGADIVVHSVTKYLNGHSDVVMGILVTNQQDLFTRLKFLQNAIGAVPAPFDCYMAMRGLKTLHIRMREHAKNAAVVAEFLEKHPAVEKVIYPGLKSHPQHELAKTQMSGFGGMITFFMKGGLKESRLFLEKLKLFALAESLGAVECLAEHPAIMTHASVPADQRAKLGISDTMCRLSVGIEDIEDILQDLRQALDAVGSPVENAAASVDHGKKAGN
jgi:cystathionine gamma-lyase